MSSPSALWPLVPLHEICSPKQWATIPQSAFLPEGYPVYGANGVIGYYSEFNHEKPTVLITCRGATCGTINLCEAESYVTGNAMALDDLDESRVERKYLVYALRNGSLAKAISGTAQPQITRQGLTAVFVPLPPLEEQRRIADVLDRAEALRVKRRAALAQLDTLTQSIFLDMFGDPATNPKRLPVRPLGQLGAGPGAIVDGPFGSAINVKDDYVEDGEIPVIRTKNVRPFEFLTDDLKRITLSKFSGLERSAVVPGDIILTKVGTIGNVCFFPATFKTAVLSTTGSCRIRPDETQISRIYLAYFLHFYRSEMMKLVAEGVQPFLNMSHIKSFRIAIPDRPLQDEFASRVSVIDKFRILQQQSLEQLRVFFGSLQHRAFRGEL